MIPVFEDAVKMDGYCRHAISVNCTLADREKGWQRSGGVSRGRNYMTIMYVGLGSPFHRKMLLGKPRYTSARLVAISYFPNFTLVYLTFLQDIPLTFKL